MSRRLAREMALQMLFPLEFTPNMDVSAVVEAEHAAAGKASLDYAGQLCGGVAGNKPDIDKLIKKYSKDWDITRLAFTDLTILRIAIYELLFAGVDAGVAINEAVELAKLYGDEDSPRFINGMLGNIVRTEQGHVFGD